MLRTIASFCAMETLFLGASPQSPDIFSLKRNQRAGRKRFVRYLNEMKKVLIIGASGGIGKALTAAFGGQEVTTLSRTQDGFDVAVPAHAERPLTGLDGPFDTIIIAIGVLGTPEKSLGAITLDELRSVFAVNTFGPALILRHVPRLLSVGGKVAVLSARVGSIGDNAIGGWHSYRASKAALNQLIRGAAIELSRTHKGSVCVALHPGTVQTAFTAKYAGRHRTVPSTQAAENLRKVIADLDASQTGSFLDYAGKPIPW